MKIRFGLLRWFFSPGLVATQVIAAVIALAYVLLEQKPLDIRQHWPWMFILFHSPFLVMNLRGNALSHGRGFLYSRGFANDTLRNVTFLAHVFAVLMVWLPVSLLIWTPVRSMVQDRLFQNPYFPLFTSYERLVPWQWLLGYGILMPVLHYAWTRRAQPWRGRRAGDSLTLGSALAVFSLWGTASFSGKNWLQFSLPISGLAAITLLFMLSWRLHRTMEAPGFEGELP